MAKEKVLIVDDDQMIRWALTEALRNWGYGCVEAGTVSAALAAFDRAALHILGRDQVVGTIGAQAGAALRQIAQTVGRAALVALLLERVARAGLVLAVADLFDVAGAVAREV